MKNLAQTIKNLILHEDFINRFINSGSQKPCCKKLKMSKLEKKINTYKKIKRAEAMTEENYLRMLELSGMNAEARFILIGIL
tara:strand:- start:136 stop:381 length:246 start_codon:yes stop_codon:yes gene_type:complete